MTGGEHVAETLARHGVRVLFTLCGGHISPILVAARARGIRVVDTRHEATAVFAADATARLTGVPGVAAVTAGPGLTNSMTALKNAQLAESPLVLLGGATATLLRGRGSLQDIDQLALVRPHVKRAVRVTRVRDLARELHAAFRVCREGVPGPVFIECPVDLLYPEPLVREWYGAKAGAASRSLADRARRFYIERHLGRLFGGAGAVPASDPVAVAAPRPAAADVAGAARALSRAERPVLLVGSQALAEPGQAAALAAALRRLGLPTFLSGMARGLLGRDDPLQLRHHRKQALREADLVILAGVPCDFRLDYGAHIQRRASVVSANRSRTELRKNRRPTLAALSAPELFLQELAAAHGGARPGWTAWLADLRGRDAQRDAEIAQQARAAPAGGVHPLALCGALEAALGEDSVVVADGGDFVATASYVLRPRGPLSWLDPGVFGTLGVGAGFALAARLARPQADVWVVYGDGSLGFSLAEADSFARHGLGVVALVGNDASWAQIAREQLAVLKDDVATRLAPVAYEQAAEALGARGFRIDDLADAPRVLAEALAVARAGRPAYVNARLAASDFRKGSLSM